MLKFLLVVAVFALMTYAVIRVIQRRGVLPAGSSGRDAHRGPDSRRRPEPPTRPVAPDDDVDFLRDLDRKRRHPEDPES
ncbi:hypothetical protein [Nocardioides sp. SYSU DS0663]|uniref:hypothetical protein n=1 Tax=Nocardioides sp. SYSU DS0663 TaxID=3416445 RepID=UPI003F4C19F7